MPSKTFYVIAYKNGTYYAKPPRLKVNGKRSARRFDTADEAERRAKSRATLYPRAMDVQEWKIEEYRQRPGWWERSQEDDG